MVANAESAEALATIALALAILAFVVQILVFIAQSQATSQQMVQSEQLNTQTRSLLTEVQTTARSTERLVGEQFRDLLKAFMEPRDGGGKFDMDTFEVRMLENLERRVVSRDLARPTSGNAPRAAGNVADPVPSAARRVVAGRSVRAERARKFREFPTEAEGLPVLAKVKELDENELATLRQFAEDEVKSLDQGGYVGLLLEGISDSAEPLITKASLPRLGSVRRLASNNSSGV